VDIHEDLEEGTALSLDFSKISKIGKDGHLVIPVVVQNCDTGEVLIVAYANEEAVAETIKRKEAVFYSTSRNELWHKGATSGDTLTLVEIRVNCEQNSLLYLVRPEGQGACHTSQEDGTSRQSCYYRSIAPENDLKFI
jgi:phosphoribosyl-AMP cyclohydrolase